MQNKTVFNQTLANSWKDFVDCPERLKTLSGFLEKNLLKHKQGYIFDAALGIGCESIYLLNRGYNVISNEIDDTLIQIARESAYEHKIKLNITQQDWRDLEMKYRNNYFDGIFILGNSLCLLDDINDIQLTLKNFYKSLTPGGTLIVDERNFPYIVEFKNDILKGNFRYSGKYIYCGTEVKAVPIHIANDEVIFGYYRNNKLIGSLKMYPFKKHEMKELLLEAGFRNVKIFSDFKHGYDKEADFYINVAVK